MGKTVSTLVIDVVTDAADAGSGLDSVGDSATRMSKQVDAAAQSAERSGRSFAVSADGADNLASKSSQATGALGALSAGFELVGLEKYAGALQGASMATDFFSGIGDSLNLVLESQAVKTAIARVNAIRHAVTSRVVAGATRVWAAAQWAMNAALNANPIGLVVVAVALLVAGIVLAYKKSATFREIVKAVGKAGREAIGWVVSKVSELVRWVSSNLPGAFQRARSIASSVFQAMTAGPRALINVVQNVIGWVRDKLPNAFDAAKNKAQSIAGAISRPFEAVLNTVKSIIDWIKKIKVPHIPGFGRVAGNARTTGAVTGSVLVPVVDTGSGGSGTTIVNNYYTVTGAIDPVGTANTIRDLTQSDARRLGLVTI